MKTNQTSSRLFRAVALFALVASTLVSSASAVMAISGFDQLPLYYTTGIDLGAAGWRYNGQLSEWAIFTTSAGSTITDSAGNTNNPTIQGNVGAFGGTIGISGSAYIRGKGYARSGGTLIRSGLAKLQGSEVVGSPTYTNALEAQNTANDTYLQTAVTDAYNASLFAASKATQYSGFSFSAVNSTFNPATSTSLVTGGALTFGDTGGHSLVLNLTDFILNSGGSLTLTGNTSTSLVINISGTLSLVNGQINYSGGVNPGNIIFNVTGTGPSVTLSGNSVFNGILLAQYRQVNVSGSSVLNGTLIASKASISGGGKVLKPDWVSP